MLAPHVRAGWYHLNDSGAANHGCRDQGTRLLGDPRQPARPDVAELVGYGVSFLVIDAIWVNRHSPSALIDAVDRAFCSIPRAAHVR